MTNLQSFGKFPSYVLAADGRADAFCEHVSIKFTDVFYGHLFTILEEKVQRGQAEVWALDDLRVKRHMTLHAWKDELKKAVMRMFDNVDAFCEHFSVKVTDAFYGHLFIILEEKVQNGQAEICVLDDLRMKRHMALCAWKYALKKDVTHFFGSDNPK